MLSFSSRDGVATTARKTPHRSEGSKRRACQDILPARAHCDTASVASGATTLTVAPAATKPSILGSPTRPAPTTSKDGPSVSRTLEISSLLAPTRSPLHTVWDAPGRWVAGNRNHLSAGEKIPKFVIAV